MIERRIRKLQRLFEEAGTTDHPHVGGQPPLMTNGMELARLEGLRSVWMQFEAEKAPNPTVTVHGVKFGALVLLGCGLELYHSLQAVILEGAPQTDCWVVSLVGGMGYAPDEAAHQRAGYAGDFVPLISGEIPFANIQEALPAELVQLAREMEG